VIARFAARLSERLDVAGTADIAAFVAAQLGPCIGRGFALDGRFREPGTARYRRHLVYVEPKGRFSVLALVWRPGQASPAHSHTGWCVVGVLEGALDECRYGRFGAAANQGCDLVETGRRRHAPADVTFMPVDPDAIHRIGNGAADTAISLHIYGRDLSRDANAINHVVAA
jgi:predicted metal-dependent enzyme (double-stranded beta helix superfamily)